MILGVPSVAIAQQIIGKRKTKDKVPTYNKAANILFPPTLNLEQSSSETTALYKNHILTTLKIGSGIAIDLTGGFGIDSFFLSRYFERLEYIEQDATLLDIAQHNHKVLGATNIDHVNTTSEKFLTSSTQRRVDLIYIDPSRRSVSNQKVFKLADCVPDVVSLREKIFTVSPCLLIKASPLLDIKMGLQELINVSAVFIVSVENECKELLFFCEKDLTSAPPLIHAVDIGKRSTSTFSFTFEEELRAKVGFSVPSKYLYEPNASILKAGAFKAIGEKFSLHKLQVSTHLYTSDILREDFPGRVFEIQELLKADAKIIQSKFDHQQANVLARNYPLTPEQIKSKYKIRDGGTLYLIGFSGEDQKFLAKCLRIK